MTDGSVWSWINGSPIKETGISEVNAIVTGRYHIVVTKTDGSAWAWGSDNSEGQLGDGTTVAHSTPALVKENTAPKVNLTYPLGSKASPATTNVSNPSIRWTQDDAALTRFGAYQVQVLNESGTVVIDSGEVTQPTTATVNAWTINKPLLYSQAYQVRVRVSASWYHTLQIKADNKVWAWGQNSNGQLGDGTTTSKTTAVVIPGLENMVSVAAGNMHSLALKSDGTVWSWGYNNAGQLGNGSNISQLSPVQVKNLTGVIAIVANGSSSYALKNDGTVWAWGENSSGQLGDNTNTNRNVPVQVLGISGASMLAAGSSYVYALTSDGTVWGWGSSSNKQIPGSTGTQTAKAVLMPGLTDIASIAAVEANGYNYGLALKKDGSVGVWGGTSTDFRTVSGLSGAQAISGGIRNHVILTDGSVWSWINGSPIKETGISEVNAIVTGRYHIVVTKTDGSAWAWGSDNSEGQ
ncbi:RCC1 domain-containing protein, partial [Paenibacillus sp. P46E]|uniref:RCC1 domain-containing protein n=1 Tax=Paenibacillus sp. P46E TaxID=1349436 RepID=UPI0015BC690A